MPELTGNEPDLCLGDYGEGVMLLQVRLYALGIYREVPDGVFNMYTENAVRELQSALGADNDGMVSRPTWEGILYLETQNAIQYRYASPYDALDQIQFDLQHPELASGAYTFQVGEYSADGEFFWDGEQWQAASAAAHYGQVSEDGQWMWDGSTWQPTYQDYAGQLSDDGRWRWNGSEWQAVS